MLAYTNRHRLQVNAASPGSENATQSVFNPTLIPVKVINSFKFGNCRAEQNKISQIHPKFSCS